MKLNKIFAAMVISGALLGCNSTENTQAVTQSPEASVTSAVENSAEAKAEAKAATALLMAEWTGPFKVCQHSTKCR